MSDSSDESDSDNSKKIAMEALQKQVTEMQTRISQLQSVPNQDETHADTMAVTQVKMQPFYETDPELWFTIVETQFNVRKITNEKSKYLHVVSNLNCNTANQVKDILKTPFVEGQYGKLKETLISIYAESSTEKFRKLISGTEIGDKKPSQFLQHMKSLANDAITDDFIKKLWIQRLPSTIRAVLSASTDKLENLAKMADSMWEVSDRFCVNSIESKDKNHVSEMEKITKLLEKMSDRISALETQRNQRKSRKDSTPQRNRNRSKSNNNNEKRNGDDELCWYHAKFGEEAQTCRKPCNYVQKN